ncbi:hypothetical protein Tsubulata_007289 [Turnera subulata]|uniref:TLC domain-containing protein n=1 Tax=Turnera subulata TaxID=218843 RepID=A0A9Q0FTI6_9ROSI|nr:hypothetical protein Tsubulata_007289 [Turnera subulata]
MESLLSHTASSSPPHPSHGLLAFYFALAFFAARFFLDKFLFQRLATWLCHKKGRTSKIDEATRGTITKCSESLWKLTYYATAEACVLKISCSQPWFWNTREYFNGWPNQELKLPLMLFYMCQCGFYIYSIAALLIWETRRKDFAVMMSHHVITVILIGYSYITSIDIADFLDLSKTYIKMLYYVFNTMLLMLLVFHSYWWVLIYSMIMRQLRNRGRVGEDIRSGKRSSATVVRF